MNTCTKCKIIKEDDQFDINKGKARSYCIECRKEMVNKHYKENKDYYKKKARKSQKVASDKYLDYKRSLSCEDCGLSFKDEPYLCDFHHNSDKVASPSFFRPSHQKFLKEVEKCTPLCANCHRRRHNKQD